MPTFSKAPQIPRIDSGALILSDYCKFLLGIKPMINPIWTSPGPHIDLFLSMDTLCFFFTNMLTHVVDGNGSYIYITFAVDRFKSLIRFWSGAALSVSATPWAVLNLFLTLNFLLAVFSHQLKHLPQGFTCLTIRRSSCCKNISSVCAWMWTRSETPAMCSTHLCINGRIQDCTNNWCFARNSFLGNGLF